MLTGAANSEIVVIEVKWDTMIREKFSINLKVPFLSSVFCLIIDVVDTWLRLASCQSCCIVHNKNIKESIQLFLEKKMAESPDVAIKF